MAGDWVEVRLSPFGEQYANGAPLRVQEGSGFVFAPGESQRVTRAFDWEKVLRPWHINGHALFEIVPEEDAAADSDTSGTEDTEVGA